MTVSNVVGDELSPTVTYNRLMKASLNGTLEALL